MQIQYTDEVEFRHPFQLLGEGTSGHTVRSVNVRNIVFSPLCKKKFAEQNGAGQLYTKKASRDSGAYIPKIAYLNSSTASAGDILFNSNITINTETLPGYANDAYVYLAIFVSYAGSVSGYASCSANCSWYYGLTGSV